MSDIATIVIDDFSARAPVLRQDGNVSVRVLVVDDDEGLRASMTHLLRQRGLAAESLDDDKQAIELLSREKFDVIFVAAKLKGAPSLPFVDALKAASNGAEVIMMAASADISTAITAVNAGAYGFVTKPFPSLEAVVLAALNAAERKRLRECASPSVDGVVVALGLPSMAYAEAKRRVLSEFNDAYVGSLLRSSGGNMSEAARRSGLDRSNFRRLVRTTSASSGIGSVRPKAPDSD